MASGNCQVLVNNDTKIGKLIIGEIGGQKIFLINHQKRQAAPQARGVLFWTLGSMGVYPIFYVLLENKSGFVMKIMRPRAMDRQQSRVTSD
jgi:hypothetical protein